MKCPACRQPMTEVTLSSVSVDVCEGGCGGIWFDHNEIDHFEAPTAADGERLLNIARDPSLEVDKQAVRRCPRCPSEVLARQFYDVERHVEINQCWGCSGIFLDPGELKVIRTQYKTPAERSAAVEQFASEAISQEVKGMRMEGSSEIARYNLEHHDRFESFLTAFKRLVVGER